MLSRSLITFCFPLCSLAAIAANLATSFTLVYQNNLNASDDANHVGFLLLDALQAKDAAAACSAVSEKLLSKASIQAHATDVLQSLSYLVYAGRALPDQAYLIDSGVVSYSNKSNQLRFPVAPPASTKLPVLCTQSANDNQAANPVVTQENQIVVGSPQNTYIGFRNKKSFRFLGIPFADPMKRFAYSKPSSATGKTYNSTAYGSQCQQGIIFGPAVAAGSEDCLFLNIQTPYIPKKGDTSDLRPVLLFIHGGGFSVGSGADPIFDGGNLASREDIVMVTFNYRLSTLGFLAIPETDIKGNFAFGDQITALEWIGQNIAAFGGDPHRITIAGESAGAGSVRVLLGSPRAIGKFQGAFAMSSFGGSPTLGLASIREYSTYLTVEESYATSGQKIFHAAGCNQTALADQIACLKALPASTVVGLPVDTRAIVKDGTIVNTLKLTVDKRNPGTAHVPVMFGILESEGASWTGFPRPAVTNESAGLQAALGISAEYAEKAINSGLFPLYNTGDITFDSFNVSARITTDDTFRCNGQATMYAGFASGAFASSYYFEFKRAINGFDLNNLGGAPVTPDFPNGNPNLPYFKLHGGDFPFVFGTLTVIRDANDLYASQLISGYFAEFVKTGQPNPSMAYLTARGYATTLDAVKNGGPWSKISSKMGPIKKLDYPSVTVPFVDVPQCNFLNVSLSYYLDGGN